MTAPDYAAALARINERIERRAIAAKLDILCMYKQAMRKVLGNRSAGQRLRRRNG